ncbi:HTH domain-containing protein [Modestobacter sp. DSM 44400]|uniref:helix-turn-helix domain-containing protein n=1 Tax=Modestobacter sp. DSM 44400 TaxID=1550230 RepID=UPI00089CF752|nr:helix-turn-helix domain-containing protein [Modestobacter sp. DSM 44400]SDY82145.1 HTH domain-containing protein [Modestobacter sp. DSM 44400]
MEGYAAARGRTPRGIAAKKQLVRPLRDDGFLDVRHSVPSLTAVLGVSRASVYNHVKRTTMSAPQRFSDAEHPYSLLRAAGDLVFISG